jgi:hypothetical protein
MKFTRPFFCIALALFVFVTGFPAQAAAAKKPVPPPDVRKVIKSVDAKASTVIILYNRDKSTHTYKVDDLTKLKLNNQDGKFADIKVGMVVDDYLERDNDDLDELSLSGYGATPPVAKPKAPAKPKPAAQ